MQLLDCYSSHHIKPLAIKTLIPRHWPQYPSHLRDATT